MAKIQLKDSVRQSALYLHSEEFEADTKRESLETRKNFVLTMLRTATEAQPLLSVSKSFLAVRAERLNAYVPKAFKDIHKCYIAKIADNFKSLHRSGSNDS